jgi:hypothetical protein
MQKTDNGSQSTAVDHIMPSFAFMIKRRNVIETHEHKGQFKEP